MALEIAKAGWLDRQSSILKRWKKTWFVLYQNGDLRYYDGPDSREAEDRIVLRAVCKAIQTSKAVDATPPDGKSQDCLINIILKDGELKLCAENPDDMKAWHIALEEARVIHPPQNSSQGPPPPYPGTVVYPGYSMASYPVQIGSTSTVVYPHHRGYPGHIIHSPYGTQQVLTTTTPGGVVYVNQAPGCYHRRRYDESDVALGVVAGAAIGSMMWGPALYW